MIPSDMPAYISWANLRTLRSLEHTPSVEPRAWSVLAHLLAAEAVWLDRLEGVTPAVPVWPVWEPSELEERIRSNVECLTRYLGAAPDLSREVHYRNSSGQEFRNTTGEILMQIFSHGAYHRGQIAAAVKRAGGEPAVTDYVMFAREARAAGS